MDLHDVEGATFTCRSCGWTGRGSEADSELFQECVAFTCPLCDGPLAVAAIPLTGERAPMREGRDAPETRWAERDDRAEADRGEVIHHLRAHPDFPDGLVVDEFPDGSLVVPLLSRRWDKTTSSTHLEWAQGWSYTDALGDDSRPPFRRIAPGTPPQKEWREFLAGEREVPLYDHMDDLDEHGWPIFGRAWEWY
jgi:hypothetical protein